MQNTGSFGLLFEFRGVRDSGIIETGCLMERNAWNEEKLYSKKKNVTAQKFWSVNNWLNIKSKREKVTLPRIGMLLQIGGEI